MLPGIHISKESVSLNQTRVHLPSSSKASVLTSGCGEGKYSTYLQATKAFFLFGEGGGELGRVGDAPHDM